MSINCRIHYFLSYMTVYFFMLFSLIVLFLVMTYNLWVSFSPTLHPFTSLVNQWYSSYNGHLQWFTVMKNVSQSAIIIIIKIIIHIEYDAYLQFGSIKTEIAPIASHPSLSLSLSIRLSLSIFFRFRMEHE